MKTMMPLMAALLIAGGVAHADPVRCTQGDQVRTIRIVEDNPGRPVPCQVKYELGEGVTEVPWRAEHDGTYCRDRAAFMVVRLESDGWSCQAERSERAARRALAGSPDIR
jgi:hypothetical protein